MHSKSPRLGLSRGVRGCSIAVKGRGRHLSALQMGLVLFPGFILTLFVRYEVDKDAQSVQAPK